MRYVMSNLIDLVGIQDKTVDSEGKLDLSVRAKSRSHILLSLLLTRTRVRSL